MHLNYYFVERKLTSAFQFSSKLVAISCEA